MTNPFKGDFPLFNVFILSKINILIITPNTYYNSTFKSYSFGNFMLPLRKMESMLLNSKSGEYFFITAFPHFTQSGPDTQAILLLIFNSVFNITT